MALTDIGTVKDWANPDLDSTRDSELNRCVEAASSWIVKTTRREIEQASYTRYFSGSMALGRFHNEIELPSGHQPVVHSGADLVTVTEDGVSLTVAIGYDEDADVTLVGANEERQCRLVRRGSRWSVGIENIAVTYKAGYTSTNVPADVKQLATEVAWLMFKSSEATIRSSRSVGGSSVAFVRQLSPQAQRTLDRLTAWV